MQDFILHIWKWNSNNIFAAFLMAKYSVIIWCPSQVGSSCSVDLRAFIDCLGLKRDWIMLEPSRVLPFPPLLSPPYIYWRSTRRYLISNPSQIDPSPLVSPLLSPNNPPIGCPATKSNFTRLAGIYEYFTQHLASSLSPHHAVLLTI